MRQFIEFNPAVGRVIPAKIADMISPELWVNIISGAKFFDHISREIFKDKKAEKVRAVLEFDVIKGIPKLRNVLNIGSNGLPSSIFMWKVNYRQMSARGSLLATTVCLGGPFFWGCRDLHPVSEVF
jgi:hypothetical protein